MPEACSACGVRGRSSPKRCRYRTCGWLVERLQGCLSGNSQHSWWVLWDDSQHIELLIDWAEKVIDDMGRKTKKQFVKVCLHYSLPCLVQNLHFVCLCFVIQKFNTMLIRSGTGWIQPKCGIPCSACVCCQRRMQSHLALVCWRQLCLCSIVPSCLQMRGIEDCANRHRRHTLIALAANAQQQAAAKLVRQTARRSQSIFGLAGQSKSTLLMGLSGSGALDDFVQPIAASIGGVLAGYQGQVSPRCRPTCFVACCKICLCESYDDVQLPVAERVPCAGLGL